MAQPNLYDDNKDVELGNEGAEGTQGIKGVEGATGFQGIAVPTNVNLGSTKDYTWKTRQSVPTTTTEEPTTPTPQEEAEIQLASGVVRVNDTEREDYVSTKELYETTLGVTKYDEIRSKLHLKDDESFTEYYERTGYIPKGYEVQAQLLLAEEKRKKLYAEHQAGNISEEDFLYEAYGKDLLKDEGIDFDSSLYWYNRYKGGDYTDPRKDGVFMTKLINNARVLFQEEQWVKDATTMQLRDVLKGIVTGVELPAGTVAELFPEFFEAMKASNYTNAQIVKYYRGGLLNFDDPTIDADGDGKIDYYYAPDGKLYNVNESGSGANTMKIYYQKDDNGNYVMGKDGKYKFHRITKNDSVGGEMLTSLGRGIGRFFTDVVDLVGMFGAAVWDFGEGVSGKGWDFDSVADTLATTQSWWSDIGFLQDIDYIKDGGWKKNGGGVNWAQIGRDAANLVGYIIPTVALAYVTGGGSLGGQAGKEAVEETGKAATKAAAKSSVKAATKASAKAASKGIIQKGATTVGKATKFAVKTTLKVGMQLTTYSNGGGNRYGSAAVVAAKDFLQTAAMLHVNKEAYNLSDGEILLKATGLAVAEFTMGVFLRSVSDESAIEGWSKMFKQHDKVFSSTDFLTTKTPNFWQSVFRAKYGASSNVALIGSTILLDSIENIASATMQTSLQSKGELWSWESFKDLFNSPQFVMNLTYQAYNNIGDFTRVTKQKVAENSINALTYDSYVRSGFQKRILDLESEITKLASSTSANKSASAELTAKRAQLDSLHQVLLEYDANIAKHMSEDIVDLKTGEVRKDSEGKALTYSKGEAILLALEDLTVKLGSQASDELFVDIKNDIDKSITTAARNITKVQFDYIRSRGEAYTKFCKDSFLRGQAAKILYGKGSRDLQMKLAEAMHGYYLKKDILNYEDIRQQMYADLIQKESLYLKLFNNLGNSGDAILDQINLKTLFGDISQKKNAKGEIETDAEGYAIYEFHGKANDFSDEAKNTLREIMSSMTAEEVQDLKDFIVIDLKGIGTNAQGTLEFKKASEYLDMSRLFWDSMTSGYSPLIKLDDGTYLLRKTSLFAMAEDTTTLGMLIRSINNIKLAMDVQGNSDAILQAVKDCLGIFGETPDDIDNALIDNPGLIKDLINALGKDQKTVLDKDALITTRDLAYLLIVLDNYYADYNAENSPKQKLSLPDRSEDADTYNTVLQLKEFIEDFNQVHEIIKTKRTNKKNYSDSDHKILNSFVNKYDADYGSEHGKAIRDLAIAHGLFGKDLEKTIKEITNFIVGKTSTSLESLKSEREDLSQGSDVTGDDIVQLLEDISSADTNETLIYRRPKTKSKSEIYQIKIQDIGTAKDFDDYLASRKPKNSKGTVIDADKLNEYTQDYIDDTVKSLKAVYNISSDQENSIRESLDVLVTTRELKNESETLSNANYAKQLRDTLGNCPKKRQAIKQQVVNNIDTIHNNTIQLTNNSNMAVILLDDLTSIIGAKIQRAIATNTNVIEALKNKDKTDISIRDILLSDVDDLIAFKKALYTLQRLRKASGSNYIELSIHSQEFKDICNALGYHDKVITEYTRGELLIPGVYYNNDSRGVVLSEDRDIIIKVKNKLKQEAEVAKQNFIKESTKFTDPMSILEDTSSSISLINKDSVLGEGPILLNTLPDIDTFNITVAKYFKYNPTELKKGKNAGALFTSLLLATEGMAAKGDVDLEYDKILKTYKVIMAFSKLYDKKNANSLQPIVMPKAKVEALQKSYGKETFKKLFLITEEKNNFITLHINHEATDEDFIKAALHKLSLSKGVKSLSELIPFYKVSTLEENFELHNNITRAESVKLASAYTPLTWLEQNLNREFDIYDFVNDYEYDGLNIKNTKLSKKDYDAAVKKMANHTVDEIINNVEYFKDMQENIFFQMQRRALKAALQLSDAFRESFKLNGLEDYDKALKVLGDTEVRRSLGDAIRKALIDNKDTLELEDGFVVISDKLINDVLSNYNKTKAPKHAEQSESLGTPYNELTAVRLQGLDITNREGIVLDADTVAKVLELLHLEYSTLTTAGNYVPSQEKILALLLASSIGTDNLNISVKDLYMLSPDELTLLSETLKSVGIENKQLDTVMKEVKNSLFYKSQTTPKEGHQRDSYEDIKVPLADTVKGAIVTKDTLILDLDYQIERLKLNIPISKSREQFVKLAGILTPEFKNNEIMMRIAEDIALYVAPYVNNPGSIQLTNLNIAENFYYFKSNLAAFATELMHYGPFKDKKVAAKVAYFYYLYSSGMQQQGAHPEFLLLNKKTGEVVDIANAGTKKDRDAGLLSRMFADYLEFDETTGEVRLKENLPVYDATGKPVKDADGNPETINAKDIVALRLHRNALNTTFSEGDVSVDIYEFNGHEKQFANMIEDKIKSIAFANDLSLQKSEDHDAIIKNVNEYFSNLENTGEVSFNRQIIREGGKFLWGNSANELITNINELSYTNDNLSASENSLNHTLNQEDVKRRYEKEVVVNDVLYYGITNSQIEDVEGFAEYNNVINSRLSSRRLVRQHLKQKLNELNDSTTKVIKDIKNKIEKVKQSRSDRKKELIQQTKAAVKESLDTLYEYKSDLYHTNKKEVKAKIKEIHNKYFNDSFLISKNDYNKMKYRKGTKKTVEVALLETIDRDLAKAREIGLKKIQDTYELYMNEASKKIEDVKTKENFEKEFDTIKSKDKVLNELENELLELYESKDTLYNQYLDYFTEFKDDEASLSKVVSNLYKDYINALNTGDIATCDTIKEVLYDLDIYKDDAEIATDIVMTHLLKSDTVEARALKLQGCDINTLKTKEYKSVIQVGDELLTLDQINTRNRLAIDIETFYNESDNTYHIYQIAIHYIDANGKTQTAVKYIKHPEVNDEAQLKKLFPDFYNKYYKNEKGTIINKGTATSFNNYLKGKDQGDFDGLLAKAEAENAILLGYNSSSFDIPRLVESGILSDINHRNLLHNQVDVYLLIQQIVNVKDLYLRGGRATLEAVADALGIKLKNAHDAIMDAKTTFEIIHKLMEKTSVHYTPTLLSEIEDLYLSITNKTSLTPEEFNSLRDAILKQVGKVEIENFGEDLVKLRSHFNNLTEHSTEHFHNASHLLKLLSERDINKRLDTLIKHFNKQRNLGVDKTHLDFAEAFSAPESRRMLIDVIAFSLQDVDTPQDIANVMTNLAKNLSRLQTEKDLVNALQHHKYHLLDKLNIDKTAFNEWKATHSSNEAMLERKLKKAYVTENDKSLSALTKQANVANAVAYSLKPISNMIDGFDFLDSRIQEVFRNEASNFYNYKGTKSSLSSKTYIDLLSKLDHDIIDYLTSDPILSRSYQSLYKLAQTVSDEKITLRNGDTELLKNDTVYMTYDTYKNLMDVTSDDLPDPENVYIPVIRHPLDKFDSIHFFKIKIIEDGQGIDVAINLDTMLSKLNGDFDGDHVSLFRPNSALSRFAEIINTTTYKNTCYNSLDNTLDNLFTRTKSDSVTKKEVLKSKEFMKVNSDKDIIRRITEDLYMLQTSQADYEVLKNKFIKDFEKKDNKKFIKDFEKKYDRKLLEDIYIKEGIDVRDIIAYPTPIYYSDLPALNSLESNKNAKRAYTIAQMAKYKIFNFVDTQTGMFQKGYLTEDYSKYGDIDLIDNAIRLSGTTKHLVDSYDTQTFLDSLDTSLKAILNEAKNIQLKNFITSSDVSNSVKLELLLRYQQFSLVNSKDYKTKVQEAVNEVFNSKDMQNDPFVKAYKRFSSGNTEDNFFTTIDEIVKILKDTRGHTFSTSKNNEYLETLRHILPRHVDKADNANPYHQGKTMKTIYALHSPITNAEDTVRFISWHEDGEPKGAAKFSAGNAYTTPALEKNQLAAVANLQQGDIIPNALLKKLGVDIIPHCQYYFNSIEGDQVIYIKTFNIDTVKTMTHGNANTKSTPTKTIDNLDSIPDSTLKTLIITNDCSLYREFGDSFKGKKISSMLGEGGDFTSDAYTWYDSDGNILDKTYDNIDKVSYLIAEENIDLLELTPSWRRGLKDTNLEELANGNNMLGTGGIGLLYGVQLARDEKGKITLNIDNQKYLSVKKKLASLEDYDRYINNGKDLYEMLAVATIIKYSDIENKQEEFLSIISSSNKKGYIIKGIKLLKDNTNLSKREKLLLSKDLYDGIYGRQTAIQDPKTTRLTSGSGKQIDLTNQFLTPTSRVYGGIENIYPLTENVNMSVVDLINYLNDSYGFISPEKAKMAEVYGLLSNKQLPEDGRLVLSNTNPKINQIIDKGAEYHESESRLPLFDGDDDVDSFVKSRHYDGVNSLYKNNRVSGIYGNSQFLSADDRGSIPSVSGMRLANLVSSLFGIKGAVTSVDNIINKLDPELSTYLSIALPTYEFDSNGHVSLTERRLSLSNKGYIKTDVPSARRELYNQRKSPYYWVLRKQFEDRHKALTDHMVKEYRYDKEVLQPEEVKAPDSMYDNLGDITLNAREMKAIEEFRGGLKEKDLTPDNRPEQVNGYAITKGDKVGKKVFESDRIGLNYLKLRDADDIQMNYSIRQIAADEQHARQIYTTELNYIVDMAIRSNCYDDLNKFAYITAILRKLDSLDNGPASKVIRKNCEDRLNSLGLDVTSAQAYLKDFGSHHFKLASAFDKLLVDLNDMCSKYTSNTNEPVDNIFFLLTPTREPSTSNDNSIKTTIISMMNKHKGDPKNTSLPIYDSYDVLESLNSTITSVCKRNAIYQNSLRMKQQGVIDSFRVQELLTEVFSDEKIINYIKKLDYTGKTGTTKESIKLISGRLLANFPTNAELRLALAELESKINPKSNIKLITDGEAYLELFNIISKLTSTFKLSLDEAISSDTSPNMIFAYRQLQDIFAHICGLENTVNKTNSKDTITNAIFSKLKDHCDKHNLTFVDRFGRTFDQKYLYMFDDCSLEWVKDIPGMRETSYEARIVMQALTGNLHYMDSALAETLSKKIFIKVSPNKIQKIWRKSAGWAIKWIMSHPLKLIDRLVKFTLFDTAALGSANPKTLANSPKAWKELRAYFASKGSVSTAELTEFLKTQGVSLEGANFDAMIMGEPGVGTGNFLKTYTDKVGNSFTFQTLFQRYAYWLGLKEDIDKGKYSGLGSAFHLMDELKKSDMTSGEKASFALGQNLGSINDFPPAAQTLNKYGFVFTTFPLAATRWGIGMFRSATAALHDIFTEGLTSNGARWLAKNSTGIATTILLEQLLIAAFCELFDIDDDDERREEWEEVGALPNVTQSLIQGEPIMDTFSSMNPYREFINLFVDTSTSNETDDEEKVSGLERFIYKNIIGHMHPLAKNVGEVALGKDLIDDQIIDTKGKYNMLENTARKASSYFLGASGANQLANSLFNSDEELPESLSTGFKNALSAELGNTKSTKGNKKNYYASLKTLNSYIYSDSSDSYDIPQANYNGTSKGYNYANADIIKSELYKLINKEANAIDVYKFVKQLIDKGYSLSEIRSSFKAVSISGKLESITSYDNLISSLTDKELQNLKTALAYEQHMFPWLEEGLDYLDELIYIDNLEYDPYIYNTAKPKNYYKPNYEYSNYNPNLYNTWNNSYTNQRYDAYTAYTSMQEKLAYDKRQAEYEANRKKWGDD